MRTLTTNIYRMADDGTDGGASGVVQNTDQGDGGSGEDLQNAGSSNQGSSRPDYIPEKYWDEASGRARVEDLGKGYIELASMLGKKDEQVRQEITESIQKQMRDGVPETPEGYDFQPVEGAIPEGYEFHFNKENPQYKEFNRLAHTIGLKPDQYNQIMSLYIQNELAMAPDKTVELAKLGENANARVERVDMWAKANLTNSSYQALVGQATTGEFIVAIEELMDKSRSADMEAVGDAQSTGPLSRQELEQMMKDPRYRDPRQRDPNYVKRVQDGFASLRA